VFYQPSRRELDNRLESRRGALPQRISVAVMSWFVLLVLVSPNTSGRILRSRSVEAKHIILLIGDGMGFEHVKATGMYLTGSEGTLSFESFPHLGEITTYCANDPLTDSAAAATAIATGRKVNKQVVSMAFPGDGSELETILEYLGQRGYRTGLVATIAATDATPAAFGAHEPDRYNLEQIADDYYFQTRPNVLFGGGDNGMTVAESVAAGYEVVTDVLGLQALDTDVVSMANGLFGTVQLPYEYDGDFATVPHLTEMTAVALDILDHDPDGFFLMTEGALIDKAAHANHIQRAIYETIEFDNMVQLVTDWATGRDDTLVIVTADHETGGLSVTQNNGQGNWPDVTWSTGGHTDVNVPIYAFGAGAELIDGVMDNTDVFGVMQFAVGVPRFTSDPISESFAVQNESYAGSIADSAIDIANEPLTFSLLSGPPWLDLAPDGALGGTPGPAHVGPNSWHVQVDDGDDGTDIATLEITVCEMGPTTWFLDADADGRGDPNHMLSACDPPAGYVANADDCNDADGGSWATPVVVEGLTLVELPDGVELTWTSQASMAGSGTVYDIATGELGALLGSGSFSGATCLADDVPDSFYADTQDSDGPGYYYLLRAGNSCGTATFGDSTTLPDPRDDLDTATPCP